MTTEVKTLFGGRGRGRDEEDEGIQFVPAPQGRGRGGFPGGGGGFPGGDDEVVIGRDERGNEFIVTQDEDGNVVAIPLPKGGGMPGRGFPGGGRGRPGGGYPGGGFPGGGYPDDGLGDDDFGGGGFRSPRGRPLGSSRPKVKLEVSLKKEFNEAVAQELENYSRQLKGRFIFINIPENQVIKSVDSEKTRFRTHEEVDAFVRRVTSEVSESGSSSAALFIPQIGIKTLAFTPLPFRLFTTQDQPYEMEAMATFYHELGHLVAPDAIGAKTPALPENVADVYGIFRHIQKYGDKSTAIEVGSWSRAWRFVLAGQGDHFTTLSIDALPKLLDKLNLAEMNPDQTARLASRIALENTPNVDVMINVATSFSNVMPTIMKSRSFEAGLKELADVTLASDQAYYTFRIGSSALKRFLDGKVTFDVETQMQLFGEQVSDFTGQIKLEGEYWDKVRKTMGERQAKLDKEGVLLGMPLKGQPKAAPEENKPKGGFGLNLGKYFGNG